MVENKPVGESLVAIFKLFHSERLAALFSFCFAFDLLRLRSKLVLLLTLIDIFFKMSSKINKTLRSSPLFFIIVLLNRF